MRTAHQGWIKRWHMTGARYYKSAEAFVWKKKKKKKEESRSDWQARITLHHRLSTHFYIWTASRGNKPCLNFSTIYTPIRLLEARMYTPTSHMLLPLFSPSESIVQVLYSCWAPKASPCHSICRRLIQTVGTFKNDQYKSINLVVNAEMLHHMHITFTRVLWKWVSDFLILNVQ
jgi:hypothetical protein